VFASGRANVTRPRIDGSVFQLGGIARASAEQASGLEIVGYLGTSKIPSAFRRLGSGIARSGRRASRCERTRDIKRDTAKMGTLIVETSESEWPWAGAVALILLALNFHIQSCHPPLGPRPPSRRWSEPAVRGASPAPDINPTCNCVMPSSLSRSLSVSLCLSLSLSLSLSVSLCLSLSLFSALTLQQPPASSRTVSPFFPLAYFPSA